jgi:polysaccharide pyruvyl transferase WcaK-like protein
VTKRGPRVGLFGLLGNGNLGNEVSMEAVLRYLRTAHTEAVVDVMCTGPDNVTSRYGIPARTMTWVQRYEKIKPRAPMSLLKLLGKGIDVVRVGAWAARHDVVIIPGMGTMEASLPLKPWGLPYSFFLLCLSGKLSGTRVAFVSVGAGEIKKRATRALLDASARLAFYRSYRDAPSLDMMRERGVDVSRDRVFSDLAFSIPPLPCGPGDPQVVGIGVMGYRGGNDDRGREAAIYASYMCALKAFALWLIDDGRAVRILIGDENEPDKLAGEELAADLRSYRPDLEPGRVVAQYATTFDELMQAMAPAGTIVATRYHSMICALRLGKPVLSLSYAPKFAAIASTMGLAEFCQSAKSPDAELMIAQFTELEKRRDELREAIVEGNARYERAAAAQFAELSTVLFTADDGR